jgi:hypothetical protein
LDERLLYPIPSVRLPVLNQSPEKQETEDSIETFPLSNQNAAAK